MFGLDLLVLLSAASYVVILVTGGAHFEVAGLRVNGEDARNPLLVLYVLIVLRFWLRDTAPFFGFSRLSLQKLPDRIGVWVLRLRERLDRLPARKALVVLGTLVTVSAAVKLANSYFHYGFFSGDDVEVHEMSMAALLGWSSSEWRPWELRGPLYPLGFVYPVQWLAWMVGAEPFGLVFSARAMVVAFSSATVVLVFWTVCRYFGGTGPAVLSAGFLALSATHVRFASSVLPRTVAAFFLVAAFALLLRRSRGLVAPALAGALLAVGGSLRLSELVFAACGLSLLLVTRRMGAVVAFAVSFGMTLAIVQGGADWAYWGSPFHSLENLFRYTFVDQASTRGFQPVHYYVSRVTSWATPLTPVLLLFSWRHRRRLWPILVWTLLPIVVLSLLPHKEARYMVPVLPFLAMALGTTLWGLLSRLRRLSVKDTTSETLGTRAVASVALAIGILLWELCGMRFPRSEDAVNLAWFIQGRGHEGVAFEQAWRAGGMIYLHSQEQLLNMPYGRVLDPEFLGEVVARPDVHYVAVRSESASRGALTGRSRALGLKEVPVATEMVRTYVLFEKTSR